MTVYCEDCTHATIRGGKVSEWRCMAAPIEPKKIYVRKSVITAPYDRCIKINHDGQCRFFEKLARIENDTDISGS